MMELFIQSQTAILCALSFSALALALVYTAVQVHERVSAKAGWAVAIVMAWLLFTSIPFASDLASKYFEGS